MRAHHLAGKFQGASAMAITILIAITGRAAPPTHKKRHAKTHVHHVSRALAAAGHASAATPAPRPAPPTPQVVAPLDAPATPPVSPAPSIVATSNDTPLVSDRSLEPQDRDRAGNDADPIRHRVALTLNPIPMIVGRFGANLEVMLASHHAVVASGFVQTYSSAVMHVLVPQADMSSLPSPLLGGEIGYRLYSGSDGPTGLFAGPSLVMMPFAYPHVGSDLRAEMVAFETYGAALDVGVQAVVAGGLTIGGGVGAQYLAYTPPASITPPPGASVPSYPEPHVLPRVLLAAGWAF